MLLFLGLVTYIATVCNYVYVPNKILLIYVTTLYYVYLPYNYVHHITNSYIYTVDRYLSTIHIASYIATACTHTYIGTMIVGLYVIATLLGLFMSVVNLYQRTKFSLILRS